MLIKMIDLKVIIIIHKTRTKTRSTTENQRTRLSTTENQRTKTRYN